MSRMVWCSGCGQDKPADQFGFDAASSTGRHCRCRECERIRQKARRATKSHGSRSEATETATPARRTRTPAEITGDPTGGRGVAPEP